MTGCRVSSGGLIDRSKSLRFKFDGREYVGHPGDTIASALLASGVRLVGRSFKYHRPRGVWGAWVDDPNAIFDVTLDGESFPNVSATTTMLSAGMSAKAVNVWPNARHDLFGGLDFFNRFLSAGFYYKTFMWPNWHLFEPLIRKMAGMGVLNGNTPDSYRASQHHTTCDLLVVGGGAAGLAAARTASEAGQSVILVDDHDKAGGSVFSMALPIEGQAPDAWVSLQISAIQRAGGQILLKTTAIGVHDHRMVSLAQDRGFGIAPRLWRVRARNILITTGALDRPVTFANNDRPGVMSMLGATEYLGRYGTLVGKDICIISNNSLAEPVANLLRAADTNVRVFDASTSQFRAIWRNRIRGVEVSGKIIPCDTILASGGLTPLVHLWRHAGGKLVYDQRKAAFLPGNAPEGMMAAGAANGTFDIGPAIEEARTKALGKKSSPVKGTYTQSTLWPKPGSKGRQWIDFQHDVTLKDIELAARENYVSVEHLKRYTTLGMAMDQGKTSNMTGLAAMASLQGKSIPETGTTTFRPPYVPVPIGLYKGLERGQLYHPLKRLALEDQHRSANAALGEYGGWLRPGWYETGSAEDAIRAEALTARKYAGIFDASPLGKIEVMGPDAEKFVDFIYYNTIRTLKSGKIRYGFMLTEGGTVYDDGVIARIDQNRFIISCSSSHVESVTQNLEIWRQDGNDPDRIFIHDTTQNWPTVTITGPEARKIVAKLDLGVDLFPNSFPHMTLKEGTFLSGAARIARVSFTGDLSFEISVPVNNIHALWDATLAAGGPLGATPIGVESLSILRAEKGYIMVGKDTDGETMPHDLGFGVPRNKKKSAFVGDRSLHTCNANQVSRRQLVGFSIPIGEKKLPTGAHLVEPTSNGLRSMGYVTSSYDSPNLGHPIALGLLENGAARMGEEISAWHFGKIIMTTVVSPVFFDPEGARIDAE